jgi:hypothetical protein
MLEKPRASLLTPIGLLPPDQEDDLARAIRQHSTFAEGDPLAGRYSQRHG